MEPFEFTSNGGGGVALLRRVKRHKTTFYEVIIFRPKTGWAEGIVSAIMTGRIVPIMPFPLKSLSDIPLKGYPPEGITSVSGDYQ